LSFFYNKGKNSIKQEQIYSSFAKNIEPYKKIKHIRGFSHKEIPKFEDEFFDIIYIDGNHEPDFVLEDAVLSFRKLRPGGKIIFDDFGWHGVFSTTRGIIGFVDAYRKKIQYLGEKETQIFIKKNT
jgi:predicted O-methyltransferase YrrM